MSTTDEHTGTVIHEVPDYFNYIVYRCILCKAMFWFSHDDITTPRFCPGCGEDVRQIR